MTEVGAGREVRGVCAGCGVSPPLLLWGISPLRERGFLGEIGEVGLGVDSAHIEIPATGRGYDGALGAGMAELVGHGYDGVVG